MTPQATRLLALLAGLSTPWVAFAQEPIVIESPIQSFPGELTAHRVTAFAADGIVRLQPAGEVPPHLLGIVAKSEGYYLLVPRATPMRGVLRVQVTDVGPQSVLTLTTTGEAAQLLKLGDLVELVRPSTVTTSQMRALPSYIPLEGKAIEEVGELRQLAARTQSINNLKQIGLALHNFNATYGSFPPAVILGPDGKPWHSWRVLILPFLEQANLYNQYDFGQPWDSDKNRKLLDSMPEIYRDPIHDEKRGQDTHYAAFVGPNAGFSSQFPRQEDAQKVPMGKGTRMPEFTDGTSNTLMVAPLDPARKIPWTKPEDITVGPKFPEDYDVFGKPGGVATLYTLGGRPGGTPVAPVLFCDGFVRTISNTVNKQVMAALLTRNGGEVISTDAIPGDKPPADNPMQPKVLKIRVEGGKAIATVGEMTPPAPPHR